MKYCKGAVSASHAVFFVRQPRAEPKRVKTVNVAELATGFSGKVQTDSHYKRLVWCLLDKRGNSNSDERMRLFNQFLVLGWVDAVNVLRILSISMNFIFLR